jgi:hypothetical protein
VVVSARELAGVEAAMAAQFLRLSVERARERERGHGASERKGGVVAPLKTLHPDWWGHGWRTVATARPRVSAGLWPVGHRGRCHSERKPTQVLDSAILGPYYS